jgi:hypothetical protein
MNALRRRVLRSSRPSEIDGRLSKQLQRRREQLAKERISVMCWMAKLKRAFHAMERSQARVRLLERSLSQLEQA